MKIAEVNLHFISKPGFLLTFTLWNTLISTRKVGGPRFLGTLPRNLGTLVRFLGRVPRKLTPLKNIF